eukprot:CAMPEP_0175062130 /NCGR_PEP_ID=MMETSP0052_2-20121109/13986_1 /TAXON_ID=51329 ORGANISM="Polytomella parva, Strain SAG 63-3" /NCGR_SAMPLE_ID=MMETSP0052_2 /ASSEMBLY_ACC=CAM_ASM_000194 /LENGTH=196 /DNA_ID=CAMNT_0016328095 /DNA_START=120 /DNA_END=711 /DNA_ORIENTATION=-
MALTLGTIDGRFEQVAIPHQKVETLVPTQLQDASSPAAPLASGPFLDPESEAQDTGAYGMVDKRLASLSRRVSKAMGDLDPKETLTIGSKDLTMGATPRAPRILTDNSPLISRGSLKPRESDVLTIFTRARVLRNASLRSVLLEGDEEEGGDEGEGSDEEEETKLSFFSLISPLLFFSCSLFSAPKASPFSFSFVV